LKKYAPHILVTVVLIATALLLLTGNNDKSHQFDDRLSFNKADKIPYGMYVAYHALNDLFPELKIATEKKKPGEWDSLAMYESNQTFLSVVPQFNPDEQEMEKLVDFVRLGNDVFISSWKVSFYAEKFIKCDIYYPGMLYDQYLSGGKADSLIVSVLQPGNPNRTVYTYPGRSGDSYFFNIDTLTSTVLGYNRSGKPNFIHLRAGKGNLYLHLAPLAFSNYFLLHKKNLDYYEKILSYLSPTTKKIVWDEYFLRKKQGDSRDNRADWFSTFLKHKSLAAALLTAMLALLLFVLSEMRRKQRPIPIIAKPKNDSMDFVKTIGRLYHDKGDHRNLSKKMAIFFLEYVRNRYKLSTTTLNDEFITKLQFKTGAEESEIREIVSFINNVDIVQSVNDKQLAYFHKLLESFYKKA